MEFVSLPEVGRIEVKIDHTSTRVGLRCRHRLQGLCLCYRSPFDHGNSEGYLAESRIQYILERFPRGMVFVVVVAEYAAVVVAGYAAAVYAGSLLVGPRGTYNDGITDLKLVLATQRLVGSVNVGEGPCFLVIWLEAVLLWSVNCCERRMSRSMHYSWILEFRDARKQNSRKQNW